MIGDVEHELLLLGGELGAMLLDSAVQRLQKIGKSEPERQFVLRNSAHIREIVDEPNQVIRLPPHDRQARA
jgi:hypothetical protein